MAPCLVSTGPDNGHLLVTPDWLVGLTPRQLDIVDGFLLGLDKEVESRSNNDSHRIVPLLVPRGQGIIDVVQRERVGHRGREVQFSGSEVANE
jgi:hypothetical protein